MRATRGSSVNENSAVNPGRFILLTSFTSYNFHVEQVIGQHFYDHKRKFLATLVDPNVSSYPDINNFQQSGKSKLSLFFALLQLVRQRIGF